MMYLLFLFLWVPSFNENTLVLFCKCDGYQSDGTDVFEETTTGTSSSLQVNRSPGSDCLKKCPNIFPKSASNSPEAPDTYSHGTG